MKNTQHANQLKSAMVNPTEARVTARERTILRLVAKIWQREYIIKQAMYMALRDSTYGEPIKKTNLIHRMSSMVRVYLKGVITGVSRYEQGVLLVEVAHQLYLLDLAEEKPLLAEHMVYTYSGEVNIIVRPRFIPLNLDRKTVNGETQLPLARKCRDSLYKAGHTMGKAYDVFNRNLSEETLTIGRYSEELLMKLYLRSGDYLDTSDKRSESKEARIIRAKEAISYIVTQVAGQPLRVVSVPDARSRTAKWRYFLAHNNEEVDVSHSWFMNFYGEGWQTALFEEYYQYAVTEAGMEDLEVAMARGHYRHKTSLRISWRKALIYFKKNKEEVIAFCENYYDHGVYYIKMAKLHKGGVGTMTGFRIETDIAASGIGSAAMNIRSLKIAKATSLGGSATPSDAHRGIVEKILSMVVSAEVAKTIIHENYKAVKKHNVEVTHAQGTKRTAVVWNMTLDSLGVEHKEVTEEMIETTYSQEMPGMLEWINTIKSITEVGVIKGHPTLHFFAADGVRCSTSAYTEARMFTARGVDKDLNSKTLNFKMKMPIEVGMNKRIVWDTASGKLRNKMMAFWADAIQAEDAYGMRKTSLSMKELVGYVPWVKHDGYHVRLGHVKLTTECIYEWRVEQFETQPIKRSFYAIQDFLKLARIELPDGDMKRSDMNYTNLGEAPFMML